MKTLGEVIENLGDGTEHLCAMLISKETWGDALNYLKEYKIKRERIFSQVQACNDREQRLQEEIARYQEAVRNCEEAENKFRKILNDIRREHIEQMKNPPLTWDELKSMEGKPVWVEVYDPIDEKTGWHTASWKLIEFINDEYFDVRNSDGEQECFYKSENDCYCWQAYRKERG